MIYSITDLRKWLFIAEKAALLSGSFLLQEKPENRKVRKDYGREVKISADKQSEKIGIDFLKSKSCFSILTEESGFFTINKKNNLYWVVDPLDGSLNFLRQIPISCISIALWEKDNPIIGVIYDFNRKELFTGIAGKGAWLNKKPILTSTVKERKKAILFTGVPVKADTSAEALDRLVVQIRKYRKCRWLGSAALSLAYVACGRGDAYLERGIMLWDIAAGVAIISGAGGKFYIKRNEKDKSCYVYAANKYLFNFRGGLTKLDKYNNEWK